MDYKESPEKLGRGYGGLVQYCDLLFDHPRGDRVDFDGR